MIEVRHLTKEYGKMIALDNVTFKVKAGEIFGIVGPNGAGKSTLISMIATILKPTSGDILVNGLSVVKRPRDVRKMIGYVPQEIALHPELTVLDNLRFWAGIACTEKRKHMEEKIAYFSAMLGLEEKLKTRLAKLSGGMKRRVNIAVAMLNNPDIVIMDEPTVGLDILSRKEIMQFIKELATQGKTVIYTSHNSDEVEYLCDRIMILNRGQKMFEGSLEEATQLTDADMTDMSFVKHNSCLDDILCYLGKWKNSN